MVRNPLAKAGDSRDTGLIRGSGRSPGEGNGNSYQYFHWESPWTKEIVGCRPWVHKESDISEQLSTDVRMHTHTQTNIAI